MAPFREVMESYRIVRELFREFYRKLALNAIVYFRDFNIFTKIYVIGGVFLFEIGFHSSIRWEGSNLLTRIDDLIILELFNLFTLMLLITGYKIELEEKSKIKVNIDELNEGGKECLDKKRVNVDMIGSMGIPLPEVLSAHEIENRGKFDISKIEGREGRKMGFAKQTPLEKNDIKKWRVKIKNKASGGG